MSCYTDHVLRLFAQPNFLLFSGDWSHERNSDVHKVAEGYQRVERPAQKHSCLLPGDIHFKRQLILIVLCIFGHFLLWAKICDTLKFSHSDLALFVFVPTSNHVIMIGCRLHQSPSTRSRGTRRTLLKGRLYPLSRGGVLLGIVQPMYYCMIFLCFDDFFRAFRYCPWTLLPTSSIVSACRGISRKKEIGRTEPVT